MSMGDFTDADRRLGQQADPVDDDPFAELARLIDGPLQGPAPAMPADVSDDRQTALAGDADIEFDLDMEAFAGALGDELARGEPTPAPFMPGMGASETTGARPTVVASYSSWLSPTPSGAVRASAAAPSPESSPVPVSPVESTMEVALRGLSAPANPRDAKYQVSEAFAPARTEEPVRAEPAGPLLDDFDALIASELAAMQAPLPRIEASKRPAAGADAAPVADPAPQSEPVDAVAASPGPRQPSSSARRPIAPDARPGRDAAAVFASSRQQLPLSRRAMGVGASLAVIALIGGAGAYLLTGSGGTVYDTPLIVKADTDPVKVAPKDPGGRDIPNQNKAVYERVQSAGAVIEPAQQTLLTAAEEPAELPQPEAEPVFSDLPGVDLNPIGAAIAAEPVRVADAGGDNSPIAVLTPRRVRTLTVNPDGTLVATAEVPATSLQELRGENPALIEAASRPMDTAAVAAAEPALSPAAEGTPAPGVPMPSMKPGTEQAAPVRVAAATPPQPAPVVTSPAEASVAAVPQPEPATPDVAAAPQPGPASPDVAALTEATQPSSGYYVQISSQPSREAAEDSSRSLGQRFAEVIGGRSMVIQSADIPGKGTYHRVRVTAESQSEANDLCQRLKSAGGSCFVSR